YSTLVIFGVVIDFWWTHALLFLIMLLVHCMEMLALDSASSALDALAALLPDKAEKVDGDAIHSVAISELTADDIVLVRPGARVPADGTIIDGFAEFDESMITGESQPVYRNSGETVIRSAERPVGKAGS